MDNDTAPLIENQGAQTVTAVCARCGEPMVVVEKLYYVHASTGRTFCLADKE